MARATKDLTSCQAFVLEYYDRRHGHTSQDIVAREKDAALQEATTLWVQLCSEKKKGDVCHPKLETYEKRENEVEPLPSWDIPDTALRMDEIYVLIYERVGPREGIVILSLHHAMNIESAREAAQKRLRDIRANPHVTINQIVRVWLAKRQLDSYNIEQIEPIPI